MLMAPNDDVLTEIFLRIGSPTDLARPSTACAFFHRLINDPTSSAASAPSTRLPSSASSPHRRIPPRQPARALAEEVDFTFSSLPSGSSWTLLDVRDGSVLLANRTKELVVCDPLHDRYVVLPAIPDDLAYSFWLELCFAGHDIDPILAPAGDEEKDDEKSFRVIWMARGITKLAAYVYSSSAKQWRDVPFDSWRALT